MTFIVLFFAIMIAIAVGVGMPTLVKHALNPAPREPRLIATIWVAIAGVIFFILSGNQTMAEVLTGVASVALGARFLGEYVWKHAQCSHAVEVINGLPTLEQRLAHLGSLPPDIQQVVLKRTLGPQLLPMYRW